MLNFLPFPRHCGQTVHPTYRGPSTEQGVNRTTTQTTMLLCSNCPPRSPRLTLNAKKQTKSRHLPVFTPSQRK